MTQQDDCPLLVRGDCVQLDMDDETTIKLPCGYGLIHDPTGICIPRCELLLGPYTRSVRPISKLPHRFTRYVTDYLGVGVELVEGSVELPFGPWEPRGKTVQIWYRRQGSKRGRYYHPFKSPVPVAEQKHGDWLRLRLPDRCVVNERGFVWP